MTRNLKALGLALVAVFAMSAVAASGAQAAAHAKCETADTTCTIKITQHPGAGLGTQTFHTALGDVTCKQVHIHYMGPSTLSSSSTSDEVKYEECELSGITASVNFGSCQYTFVAPFETFEGHGRGNASIGAGTCKVEINVGEGLCKVFVNGGQSFTNAITYTNVETGGIKEITIHADTGENIHYNYEGSICGTGSGTTGRYTGTLTAKAFRTPANGGTQIGLSTVDT